MTVLFLGCVLAPRTAWADAKAVQPRVKVFWLSKVIEQHYRSCPIVYCPVTREAAIVDLISRPGVPRQAMADFIEKEKLTIRYILLPTVHCVHPQAWKDELAPGQKPTVILPPGYERMAQYLGGARVLAKSGETLPLGKLTITMVQTGDNPTRRGSSTFYAVGDRIFLGDNFYSRDLNALRGEIEKRGKSVVVYWSPSPPVSLGYLKASGFNLPATSLPRIGCTVEAVEGSGRGLAIATVTPDGSAARAGVQAGDVVLSVNGRKVDTEADLKDAIHQAVLGRKLALEVKKKAGVQMLQMELGRSKAILGWQDRRRLQQGYSAACMAQLRGEWKEAIALHGKAIEAIDQAARDFNLAAPSQQQRGGRRTTTLPELRLLSMYQVAALWAVQEEVDKAAEWLRKAQEGGYPKDKLMDAVNKDRRFDSVRDSAAFKKLS